MLKKLLLISCLLLLSNCASRTINTYEDGSSLVVEKPRGTTLGAYTDEHKEFFVKHMINAPTKITITNWHNPRTGNSGIIRTSRVWNEGLNKCGDYESTINITPSLPVAFAITGPIRKTDFGVACVTPEKQVYIKQ